MPAISTFGQRFRFSRDFQRVSGRWTSDGALADELGLESQSQISNYKTAVSAPPSARVLAIAKRTGVDPGWLAFGAESAAPEPPGFAAWLLNVVAEPGTAELVIEGHAPTAVITAPDLSRAVKLTEQDAARADVKARRDKAERLARETKGAARAGRKRRPK